jgi:hypothetical protein
MAKKEIMDLISKEIDQGLNKEQIVSDLIFAGFSYQDIQGAFNQMEQEGKLPEDFLISGRSVRKQTIKGPAIKKIEELTSEYQVEEENRKEVVSKYKTIALKVLLILVVISGVFFAGFYFYSTSSSVVIKKTLANVSKVRSAAFYVSANVDINKSSKNNNDEILKELPDRLIIESRGLVNTYSPVVDYSLEIALKNADIATSSQLLNPFWGIGAISTKDSNFYLKLNNLETSKKNETLSSKLLENWVVFDISDNNLLSGIVPKEILKTLLLYQRISSPAAARVFSLISDSLLVEKITSLGSQKIDGVPFYHYQIVFNKNKASYVVSEFYSLIGKDIGSGWIEELVKNPWEVWIDKKTLLPYQIIIRNVNPNSNFVFNPREVTIILSGFNASYQISHPAQFFSLKQIIQLIQDSKKENE